MATAIGSPPEYRYRMPLEPMMILAIAAWGNIPAAAAEEGPAAPRRKTGCGHIIAD